MSKHTYAQSILVPVPEHWHLLLRIEAQGCRTQCSGSHEIIGILYLTGRTIVAMCRSERIAHSALNYRFYGIRWNLTNPGRVPVSPV